MKKCKKLDFGFKPSFGITTTFIYSQEEIEALKEKKCFPFKKNKEHKKEGFIEWAIKDIEYLENEIKKDLKNMEIVTITYYEKTELEIILNFQEYFIKELEITPSLDLEGYGSIKVDSFKAFICNGDGDQEEIKFKPEVIAAIENELKDFYDWDEYIKDQEPDPDRYRD